VRHADIGMEAPTTLTRLVTQFFEVETVADMLRRFWLRPLHPPPDTQVSKLAPIVLTEAENGDPVARQMIEAHGVKLADYALAAARQVGIADTRLNVVLNGGIFRHPGTFLKDTIERRIRDHAPDATMILSRYEPVVGAVLLAFEALNMPITESIYTALDASMPSKDVFRTS
jgi:N-acetylglucosamine kinase-like BadF-type ATPase